MPNSATSTVSVDASVGYLLERAFSVRRKTSDPYKIELEV